MENGIKKREHLYLLLSFFTLGQEFYLSKDELILVLL